MRQIGWLVALLVLLAGPAQAGPNAGGTLVAHDTGLVLSSEPGLSYPSPAPAQCPSSIDAELPLGLPGEDAGWVWKVYAVFPTGSSPRLKAFCMGSAFPANVLVAEGGLPDPVSDFEIPQGGWPTTSGGGVGISFWNIKTDLINEVYWFGGYAYGGAAEWSITAHPVQQMIFVDDSMPPLEDLIVGLGSIGFGMAGQVVCPEAQPVPGACCFADGHCEMQLPDVCAEAGGTYYGGECQSVSCPTPEYGACCVGLTCHVVTPEDCAAQEGVYQGPDTDCDPNPCEVIPVEETTWGKIKNRF